MQRLNIQNEIQSVLSFNKTVNPFTATSYNAEGKKVTISHC